MKISRLLKAAALFTWVTVTLLLLAIVLTPSLLESKHIRKQVKQVLSKWAGGQVRIAGAIQINYFLGAQLSAENVIITDFKTGSPVKSISADSMNAHISWLSLLTGRVSIEKLILVKPNFVLTNDAIPANLHFSKKLNQLPLARLIKRATVSRMAIQNGMLDVSYDGVQHQFSNINGTISFAHKSRKISGETTFIYLDQLHRLNFRTNKLRSKGQASEYALQYGVRNPLLRAGFKGQASVGKNIELTGHKTLQVLDIQKLAHWIKKPLPNEGPGLKDFDLSADLSLKGKHLTLSDASLRLDGNKASGTLKIALNEKTSVSGSLDIGRFSLLPYIPQEHADSASAKPKSNNDFLMYILNGYTADLRISANEVLAPNFQAEDSALAIYLHKGRMFIDVADMKVCNGSANGQLEISSEGALPKVSILGIFNNISTSQCLGRVASHDVVRGKASINVRLTGQGQSWDGIFKSLEGNWSIKMPFGGQVSTDLANFFGSGPAKPMKGWRSLKTGVTRFENLDISSDMRDGTATIHTVMLAVDKRKFSGKGSIDIPQHSLNYQVVMFPGDSSGVGLSDKAGKNVSLKVRGSWTSPEIALDTDY